MPKLRNQSQPVRVSPQEQAAANAVVQAAFGERRNFSLGVANGFLGGLLDPLSGIFVLTLFLTTLNAPPFLVGLLPAMWSWGILLPQIVVAGKVRGKRRVMPWYKGAAIVRVVGLAGSALCAAVITLNPDLVLPIFFAFYLLYAVGSGVSGIPFIEIVGKIVPDHRKGTFYGLRQFGGAAVSMVASAVAGVVIAGHLGLGFPYNFAAMFAAAAVGGGVAFWLWALIREPDLKVVEAPKPESVFRLGMMALKNDRDYRLFTVIRLLGTFASIASPFYLVYVTKVMRVPLEAMGLYMMASTGVSLVSSLLWAPIANRAPRHRLVELSTGLQLVNIVCSLAIVTFGGALPPEVAPFAAAPVFLLTSLAGSAALMFNDTTLLSITPPGERPTYFGFLNTLSGAASLVLPLGGVILAAWGYFPLFGIAALLAIWAFVASIRLGAAVKTRTARHAPKLARLIVGKRVDKAL